MASTPSAHRGQTRSPESFESQQMRDNAAEILESYEKLSWVSFNRHESIPQTRLYLQKIIAGFDPAVAGKAYWKEDFTPHPSKENEQPQSSRKGKERVSFATSGETPVQAESSTRRVSKGKPPTSTDNGAVGSSSSSSRKRQHGSEMDIS
ncbi:uncharacterized protein K489DRAFT_382150 [Dissoconium aciculare CBS 342.82]|uniref:Uncharacterized protein n=1 Tax=Dissoconium aciculare CBS 342.82 TaxID=1314786 RepID=A0A6J3M0T6_9PEZI|nr:uncharacterized protein K489DRAFT_382150 [Dissoconium aciculare CBS 342.82]KAF1821114.1 hypothetical protein K489DRAFT_382150 [Dissoconium aciculare CBS 342.82]